MARRRLRVPDVLALIEHTVGQPLGVAASDPDADVLAYAR
jgi:hypothetical protein